MSNIISKRILVFFRKGLKNKHRIKEMIKDKNKLPSNIQRRVNRGVNESILSHNKWVKNLLKQIENVLIVKYNPLKKY